MDLRQELEDINQSLEHLHRNPNNTAIGMLATLLTHYD